MNLERYISPENESSVFKGIPISMRHTYSIRNLMMTRKFSVRYRGKSKLNYVDGVLDSPADMYIRPQAYCHKDHAETFAIYPYSNY